MRIRVAATEVSHWHSMYDAAYLPALVAMADVEFGGLHDPVRHIAAQHAAVLALCRHSFMAELAEDLLDRGYPFLMEKPMGVSAFEVARVVEKAAATGGFAPVPFVLRYHSFAVKARQMLAVGDFGPLSHITSGSRSSSARYRDWHSGWMLDPAVAGGGR
jgi:predicted dehydrogenase